MTGLEPAKDTSPLTKAAARKLTSRIATATGMLWHMIAEAHEREAWRALGYDSWAAYVDAEFQISRGQAFRLLDQARVTAALEAATGEPVAVSARQAAVLRHEPDKAAKHAARAVKRGVPVKDAVAREVERVRSHRTSNQERATEGGDPTGTPTQPRARGGAAATAEKVAEAPTAAPKPAVSSTPPSGADQGPSAPAPSSGAPATADGVRYMVAMVTTTGADVLAHCCEPRALAAAVDTLTAALKRKTKPPAATSAARPVAAAPKRDVTPRLKGMR